MNEVRPLAAVSIAQARHLSYKLLSQLFFVGLNAETLPMVEAVPELAACLPSSIDLDEAAASHYQLFGFNVYPYETVFLDRNRMLGGNLAESVAVHYKKAGFFELTGTNHSDHVGQELAFLGFLCHLEKGALQTDLEKLQAIQGQQIAFMENHILRWLVPLLLAIKQQEDKFFTAVAELTVALLYDHYQYLCAEVESVNSQINLPQSPKLLDDEKTGLKELAAFFTTFVYSGFYLSRDDVGRLARPLNLPRGFGDRQQLMTNLMRTAGQYEQFPILLEALETIVRTWQQAYQSQSDDMPLLKLFLKPWQQRTIETLSLIGQIRTETKPVP